MALKKSQLYSTIWEACNNLRGGMDASQYKDYVLVLLFVRYVSDKYAGKSDALVDVPKGGSFSDLVALKGNTNIGEGINKVLSKLAEANGLKGVIDIVDFNDEDKLGKGKEMQDRLSDLVAIFESKDLNFSKNRAEGDDLLGDAYEYLMKHFAVESGKSKGQFYTPAEVSRIIAKVIGAENAKDRTQTVYDPACGSGSLLLKVAAEAKPVDISIYGQEKDNATAALAILNMWLHSEPTAVIKKGQSTLSNPLFLDNGALKTFDFVVANPPFSDKKWRFGFDPENDTYSRFEGFGIPPTKNGDYAFLLHIIKSLKSTGKGACVLPHGVLFRGNAEAEIRTNLIKRGYIKGIIGLPANLFFGTGIPACIVILDKENAQDRKGIFMIDASKGFIKDGNKNRLRERDIRKIIDIWEEQAELDHFSHFANNDEIEKNEYNLNLPRYIDTSEPEDLQDIEAHLHGGIPKYDIDSLAAYWGICKNLKKSLVKNNGREGYFEMAVEPENVRQTILDHSDFANFKTTIKKVFDSWKDSNFSYLKSLDKRTHPKAIIAKLGKELLTESEQVKLVDKYDIYQNLMAYWEEVMQDDAHTITADDWQSGNQVIRLQKENKGKKKDIAGLAGLEGRLVPTSLIISTYLRNEQEDLDKLKNKLEQTGAELEETREEHAGDEGLLESVVNEKGNITKGDIKARIKEIKDDSEFSDELEVLQKYFELMEKEAELKKQIKKAEAELEKKVIEQYPKLSIEEIKKLVVEDKWLKTLEGRIMNDVDQVAQNLATRVKELAERYEETLPKILKKLDNLSKKVGDHITLVEDLLTGKKRLPGFSGEWKEKSLGEIGIISGSGIDKTINSDEQPIRLVNYLDVFHKDFIYSKELNHWVTAPSDKIQKCSVKKGDIFFTPSSEMRYEIAISTVAMEDIEDAGYSYHVTRLRLNEENKDWDFKFRSYIFKTKYFLDQAETICEGSGKRYVISLTKFRQLKIRFPKDPKEQTAISNVISDMDSEIDALEKSLKKYRQIKTGMMQNLLTGKIRLIKN